MQELQQELNKQREETEKLQARKQREAQCVAAPTLLGGGGHALTCWRPWQGAYAAGRPAAEDHPSGERGQPDQRRTGAGDALLHQAAGQGHAGQPQHAGASGTWHPHTPSVVRASPPPNTSPLPIRAGEEACCADGGGVWQQAARVHVDVRPVRGAPVRDARAVPALRGGGGRPDGAGRRASGRGPFPCCRGGRPYRQGSRVPGAAGPPDRRGRASADYRLPRHGEGAACARHHAAGAGL